MRGTKHEAGSTKQEARSPVYIGIGSNVGDRLANCIAAIELLGQHPHVKIIKLSHWYETEALDANQDAYMNGVVEISTDLTAKKLLRALQAIETKLGRPSPRPKGQPRTIDLDILLYECEIMDDLDLKIPHPEIAKRLFVLLPLCDIAPKLLHPTIGKSMQRIMQELKKENPDYIIRDWKENR